MSVCLAYLGNLESKSKILHTVELLLQSFREQMGCIHFLLQTKLHFKYFVLQEQQLYAFPPTVILN